MNNNYTAWVDDNLVDLAHDYAEGYGNVYQKTIYINNPYDKGFQEYCRGAYKEAGLALEAKNEFTYE